MSHFKLVNYNGRGFQDLCVYSWHIFLWGNFETEFCFFSGSRCWAFSCCATILLLSICLPLLTNHFVGWVPGEAFAFDVVLQGISRFLNAIPAKKKKKVNLLVFNNLKPVILSQSCCNLIADLMLCLNINKTRRLSYCCIGFHSSYVTFLLLFFEEEKKVLWFFLFLFV